jgi:hypothetical protein
MHGMHARDVPAVLRGDALLLLAEHGPMQSVISRLQVEMEICLASSAGALSNPCRTTS